MNLRVGAAVVAALLLLAPPASQASLSPYSQDFETLVQTDPAALTNNNWLVYGNVFSPDGSIFLYGYGAVAPNNAGGFCGIDIGQGGIEQGAQQLVVFSDYNNNGAHAALQRVESNVYQEQVIGASDIGTTWTFQFDAKLGLLAGSTTALAFIKTLDPSNNYALTNFRTFDTTSLPATWGTYFLGISLTDASLAGQILQFGFANTATNFIGSGVFYDNLHWFRATTDVAGPSGSRGFELRGAAPNPFMGSTRIDYATAREGMAEVSVYDVTGRRVATLFRGVVSPGAHSATWDGRRADGGLAPAGVYHSVLQTNAGRQARRIVLNR